MNLMETLQVIMWLSVANLAIGLFVGGRHLVDYFTLKESQQPQKQTKSTRSIEG